MKNKKISISIMLMGLVVMLWTASIVSSIVSVRGISSVNKEANVIAEEYLSDVALLGEMRSDYQEIFNLAVSYVMVTDFQTSISVPKQLQEKQEAFEKLLKDNENTFRSYNNQAYEDLVANFEELKNAIEDVMVFCAAGNMGLATEAVNGSLKTASENMDIAIEGIVESATKSSDEAVEKLHSTYSKNVTITVVMAVIGVIIGAFAIICIRVEVIKPINGILRELSGIISDIEAGQGDLTKRITTKRNIEINALSSGINNFIEKLQHILGIISTNSVEMQSIVSEVATSVNTSNDSVADLSALTQELTATMQEVSSNTSMINEGTQSVKIAVGEIAGKTKTISDYSKDMKATAERMGDRARTNMQSTKDTVADILAALNVAMENSKNVEKVNDLTNDILNISTQTNLLALNASIEAARAGAAGKGFAVVADEISKLADSSEESANNIQHTNQIVTASVKDLSDNTQRLVDFLQTSILPDFEEFVKIGDTYKENADYIDNVMKEFSAKTDKLDSDMTGIADSIENITVSIDHGVTGISGAADSTQGLVANMENITMNIDKNKAIAGELLKETEKFVKLV